MISSHISIPYTWIAGIWAREEKSGEFDFAFTVSKPDRG
jgi:hypothetical protein